MPGDTTKYNIPFVAPSLPNAKSEYSPKATNEHNRILRQYFNQLDNALRNIAAVDVPYNEQVARGEIAGASSVFVYGYLREMDQNVNETLQYQGGLMQYPSSAATVFISSADANDTSAGTGARTLLLEGLDANYAAVSETITMNGQTQVESSKSYIRLFKITSVTVGSGGKNAGDIYVATTGASSGVPTGTTYLVMESDDISAINTSQAAVYTVPAGHTLYIDLVQFKGSSRSTISGFAFATIATRTTGSDKPFVDAIEHSLRAMLLDIPFPNYLKLEEKSDIELRCFTTNADAKDMGGNFTGILIKN